MKRFKKLVSVLTLTAMLAASLTACGGKDPVAEDDSTAGRQQYSYHRDFW